MPLTLTTLLLVAPALSLATSDTQDKLTTPAQHYRALQKQYNTTSGEFRQATTDEERTAAVLRLQEFAPKFLDIAEEHPEDPIALTALRQAVQAVLSTDSLAQVAWEMNTKFFPAQLKTDSAARIGRLVRRDHLQSARLGPVCERMRYGLRGEFADVLHSVRQKNPHKEVQAIACLARAQLLNNRLQLLQLMAEQPKSAGRYEALFGGDFVRGLRRSTRADLAKTVETLFEQAVEYGDVKLPGGVTVGEQAKRQLYDIRHLSIGKSAPDIAGKDQDGKEFKLSDYRGKVVLLYFWMEY